MKKLFSTIAIGACLLAPAAAAAGSSDADIMREIESLKRQLKAQQEVIDALKSKLGDNLSQAVQEEIKKSGTTVSKVQLANKFIDNLTLKGDLRVRYERRDRDNYSSDDDARDRFRTRFRVGGVWKNDAEDWEVGAGLATGSDDPTSTNDTWSENNHFETGDIRLDYAYAKHKLNDALKVTLGQHKNPYETSWALWDGDVRPAGFTGQFNQGGLFVTAGGYDVYQAGNDVSMMFAGQVGYGGKMNDLGYKLAVAYYDFDSKVFDLITRPNPNYDYRIGDLYGELSAPFGSAKVKAYGQVYQNFGADGAIGQGLLGGSLDPESEDMGWVLGLEAKIDKVKLGYAYAQIGADSVIPSLKDSDFGSGIGSGVDVEGHKLSAAYSFTKNFSLGATALLYEPMERPEAVAGVKDVALYQLDFKYKF